MHATLVVHSSFNSDSYLIYFFIRLKDVLDTLVFYIHLCSIQLLNAAFHYVLAFRIIPHPHHTHTPVQQAWQEQQT